MNIYRCDLTLMEATFFSSREISDLYQTEPVIGNYALAYAMGWCKSAYFNEGKIHYREHLTELNERGIYIMPGTLVAPPRFILRRFNAQTDAYWSAFGAGVIAARSDYGWSEKHGQHWYCIEPDGEKKRLNPTNRPQSGRIRLLAAGNRAVTYVISRESLTLPRYIRLGKFMSKARVESQHLGYEIMAEQRQVVRNLLNPADLGATNRLLVFDMVNVPPMPLIHHAEIQGTFYKLDDGQWVPQGMFFNVEGLQ